MSNLGLSWQRLVGNLAPGSTQPWGDEGSHECIIWRISGSYYRGWEQVLLEDGCGELEIGVGGQYWAGSHGGLLHQADG